MKISNALPPMYERICKAFPPAAKRTVFTWGDTIHVPSGNRDLPWHLHAHEHVHSEQQGTDPKAWWERYLVDSEWRYEQEVAAYKVQYASFCKREKSKNAQALFARAIAENLAGPLYGKVVDFDDAIEQIRQAA